MKGYWKFAGQVLLALGVLVVLVLISGSLLANSGDISPPKDPNYAEGRKLVKKGDYAGAVPYLEKAIATDAKNADAENDLGYSFRKLGQRDKALAHYQRALAIDPEHRGANEYLGELYLEMGDLAKAQERLDVLDGACFWGCDEYRDLKASIKDYKAKTGS